MPTQHTVYWSDDEGDMEWVERIGNSVFGSKSQLYKKAIEEFRNNHGNSLESIATEDNDEIL